MIVPFKACSTMMVTGATGTGKSTFIHRLLSTKDAFTKPVHRIIYCYGIYQPLFDTMKKDVPNIEFYEGIITDFFFVFGMFYLLISFHAVYSRFIDTKKYIFFYFVTPNVYMYY